MTDPELELDVIRRVVLAAEEGRFSLREWFIYAKALAALTDPRDSFAVEREVFKRARAMRGREIQTVDDAVAAVSPHAKIQAGFSALFELVQSLEKDVVLALLGDTQIRGAVEEARIAAYAAIGKHPPGSFAWARAQHELGLSTESDSSGATICASVPWELHRFSPAALDATDWKLNAGGSEP
jgi:hypothetical protein